MNRRNFITSIGTAGLGALIIPRMAFAEEGKGEEEKEDEFVPAMYAYPWDGIYKTEEEILEAPFYYSPPQKIIKEFDLNKIEKCYKLFKDPKKIKSVFGNILDGNIKNEELSSIIICDSFIGLRILTLDKELTSVINKSKKDPEKFKPSFLYFTTEDMSSDKIKEFSQYF